MLQIMQRHYRSFEGEASAAFMLLRTNSKANVSEKQRLQALCATRDFLWGFGGNQLARNTID